MFSQLNLWLGAAAGAAMMATLAYGYNKLIDNPSLVSATTAKVEAEARERTYEAINEVTNAADRARAMRYACIDSGKLFNYETGKCRD